MAQAEMLFKTKELSILYDKLSETKKKLENSKLSLKISKAFDENSYKSPHKDFSATKSFNFLDIYENNSQLIRSKILENKEIKDEKLSLSNRNSFEKVLKSSIYENNSKKSFVKNKFLKKINCFKRKNFIKEAMK